MRLREYFATLDREPIRMTLGFDEVAITLLLKPLDRLEFEDITNRTSRKEVDPLTRQMVRKQDEKKLRREIIDKVLLGWEGLTHGIAAKLARRVPVNGTSETAVEFTPENAEDLLGTVLGIENEIWKETLRGVDRRETEEAEEKKT